MHSIVVQTSDHKRETALSIDFVDNSRIEFEIIDVIYNMFIYERFEPHVNENENGEILWQHVYLICFEKFLCRLFDRIA